MTIKRLPLVLGMLFALFAGAQAQGVWVCGHKLTSGQTYDSSSGIGLSKGSIKYVANGNSEATVDLDGVEINAASSLNDYAFHTSYNYMTITLKGTNKVTAKNKESALLLSGSDMKVDGTGSLEIEAIKSGMDYSGTLRINDAHIKVKGGTYGINSTSPLYMSGTAMLEAYGGETASLRAESFSGTGFGIKIPYEAKFVDWKLVVDEDGNTVKGQWVVIEKGIPVNKTNFPDDNFRNWVISQDYGADHFLDEDEIADVKTINVSGQGIKKLNGIKFFTALQYLDCKNNELSALDLSSNEELKYLDCNNNQLSSSSSFEYFIVKNCPKLVYLNCQNNNLRYLDISGNTFLTALYCANNRLTSLNVKNNTILSQLSIYGNKITDGMKNLVNDLSNPDESVRNPTFTVVCSQAEQDNVITPAQIKTVADKGWTVQRWNGTEGEDITFVEINETNFPDENFRNFLLEQDYGKDGFLMDTELATVTDMDLTTRSISKLDGIGFFTELTRLICQANMLNKLDVSKNTKLTILNCSMNGLSQLDLSHNTALTSLICRYNGLSTLDLSNNTALTTVSCEANIIRVDGMTALVNSLPESEGGVLYVVDDHSYNDNIITTAQVNVAMGKGWTVKKFNDAGQPEEYAGFDPVAINETNFPDPNFRAIVKDKAINTDEDDYLSEREVMAVTELDVNSKSIATLTGIEHFTVLTFLYCNDNSLKTLDLSNNTHLFNLSCSGNGLESLNVTNNTALAVLYCNQNNLKTLDLSQNTALGTLACPLNKLTSLDVSNCPKLGYLSCYGNNITGDAMATLVNGLPEVTENKEFLVCSAKCSPDNAITTAQVSIAKGKGWTVKKETASGWVDYDGFDPVVINETNFPDANFRNYLLAQDYGQDAVLTEAEILAVRELNVLGKAISNLTGIEYFTALQVLYCGGNYMTSLDVSKNTALTKLICGSNHSMTSLNVSANKALTNLDCSGSSLTSLNVSQNTALKELLCYNNSLTSLDVSANTALELLRCEYNSLTSLTVSKTNNMALKDVFCAGNQISGTAMTNLVNGLPTVTGDHTINVCDDTKKNDNVITAAQVKTATDKGWMVLKFNGSWSTQYAGHGDANGDNKIDKNDVDAIEQIIMGQSSEGVGGYAGDLNNDGKVDAVDIVVMNNILKSLKK